MLPDDQRCCFFTVDDTCTAAGSRRVENADTRTVGTLVVVVVVVNQKSGLVQCHNFLMVARGAGGENKQVVVVTIQQ